MQVRIRRGVHEVDRIGHAILHRELDRIQVVPQSLAQRQRVLLHALQQLRAILRRVVYIPLRVRPARVVRHDVYLRLPHDIAAEVLRKLHRRLQRHAQVPRLVVRIEELIRIVDVEDIAPTAAIVRLQERRKLHILEDALPVQRILQVPQRLRADLRRKELMWQQHRPRHRHAQLLRQRVVEELVVRRPPERVVDHLRAVQNRILQIRPIERQIVRDPIYDHRVARGLAQLHPAQRDELRLHPLHVHRVDPLDQRARKRVLHPEQDTNLLHREISIPPGSSQT